MGSKKKENAEKSKEQIEKKKPEPVPKKNDPDLPCDKENKHWVGVRVEDEKGKLVKDVTVHLKLPDGSDVDIDMATAAVGADGAYKTCKTYDPGTCDFSFPSLFNLEWWPKGAKAGAATANGSAVAADGDCAVSIAEALGFREYHSVWDRSENTDLKSKRVNPNHLTPADTLKTPDQKDKIEKKAMDQVWTFVVKTKILPRLRVVLTDKDGKALGNKEWEFKSPIVETGKTGADGLLEIDEIPGKYKSATVQVTLEDAKVGPAAPAAPTQPDPPPYPLVVLPADFKDKNDPIDFGKLLVDLEFKLGSLEAFDQKLGILVRLRNLGFGCDVDSDDARITKAVKAYQRWFLKEKKGSGKTGDIQADLKKRHDNK